MGNVWHFTGCGMSSLSPLEKAEIVERQLWEIREVGDSHELRRQFDVVMGEAQITDAASRRELWLVLKEGNLTPPLKQRQRPNKERASCDLCAAFDAPLVTIYPDDMPPLELCRVCEEKTGLVPIDNFLPRQ